MRSRWIVGTLLFPLVWSCLLVLAYAAESDGPDDESSLLYGLATVPFYTLLLPSVFVGQWLALRRCVRSPALWLIPGLLTGIVVPLLGISMFGGQTATGFSQLHPASVAPPSVWTGLTAIASRDVIRALAAVVLATPIIAAWKLGWYRWVTVALIGWATGTAFAVCWRIWGYNAVVAVIGASASDPQRHLLADAFALVTGPLVMWAAFGCITAQFFWHRALLLHSRKDC